MGKLSTADQLSPFENIANGNFNPPTVAPGTFVSTLSLDGWTISPPVAKGAVVPVEIISGPYAGMPALSGGAHYWDTLSTGNGVTAANPVISQTLHQAPNQPSQLEFDAYYQFVNPAQHTNLLDHLLVTVSGDGFGVQTYDFSFADMFAPKGATPFLGEHVHESIVIPGATSGFTTVSFQETGPGVTGNVGVGLTGVSDHSYSVINGQHF